jgi:hypothetical protein
MKMPKHLIRIRPAMRRWEIPLLILAILAGTAACKRGGGSATAPGQNAPTAARLPRLPGPTTEAMEKENHAKLLAGLYLLEPLGAGVVHTAPDGEVWTRFRNGLMIHDLRPSAEGLPPRLGQTVTVAYVGTIPDSGKVFDSRDAGNPLTFMMASKNLIQGFSLGLSTLRVGGKRRIFVPPDLGYGVAGNPQAGIGGDQALIFEVELLKVSGEPVVLTAEDEIPKAEPLGPPAPKPATIPATAPAAAASSATRP